MYKYDLQLKMLTKISCKYLILTSFVIVQNNTKYTVQYCRINNIYVHCHMISYLFCTSHKMDDKWFVNCTFFTVSIPV